VVVALVGASLALDVSWASIHRATAKTPGSSKTTTSAAANLQYRVSQGPLTPLPAGAPQIGFDPSDAAIAPLVWQQNRGTYFDVTPVGNGVDMKMLRSNEEAFLALPADQLNPYTRLDTEERIIEGPSSSEIGAGCWNGDTQNLWFQLANDGTWSLDRSSNKPGGGTITLLTGSAPSLGSLLENTEVSVVCNGISSKSSRFMLAVNGRTVANLTVEMPETSWEPILVQCSCGGVDGTARFTNTLESSF
jgi:hypothetical protein